jgi:hypothetical protein
MPDIDTSQLQAVNTMLSLIGEAPVNSLTTNVTADVALAIRTLDEVSRQLQARGWHWNTIQKLTVSPDANGRYAWQQEWIRFDPKPNNYTNVDVARRGEFLYDWKNGTDVFTQASLEGSAVIYLPWDDIPEVARNYAMIRASRIYVVRALGDEVRAGFTTQDERRAWQVLEEEENEQADYNYFHTGAPLMARRRSGVAANLLD